MDTSKKQSSIGKELVGCGVILLILTVVVIAILLILGPVVGNVFSQFPDNRIRMDGIAQAWLDENENGIWEANEAPLPGVEFSITYSNGSWIADTQSDYIKSDWKGRGHFPGVLMSGCPDRTEVYAKAPAGYRLTTPGYLDAGEGCVAWRRDADNPFLFGFTYLPGVATVTPFPKAPTCTSFPVEWSHIPYEMTIAPDNTVWFTTLIEGVFHLNPATTIWKNYKAEDGLASDEVTSLAISANNTAWFGTRQGISRFDGTSWTTYTTTHGLQSNIVTDIAIDPDDIVWSTSCKGGISRFVPDTNSWIAEVMPDNACGEATPRLYTAFDGSLWFALIGNTIKIKPFTPRNDNRNATSYNFNPFEGSSYSEWSANILPANKRIWVLTSSNFGYFDLSSETWRLIERDQNFTAMSFQSNEAVWLGLKANGIRQYNPGENNRSGFWTDYINYELSNSSIWTMSFAPPDILWVGTTEGATRCIIQE